MSQIFVHRVIDEQGRLHPGAYYGDRPIYSMTEDEIRNLGRWRFRGWIIPYWAIMLASILVGLALSQGMIWYLVQR
jgi:hypothetical protein